MSSTLYELTSDWLTLLDILEDGADEEVIQDTLEGLDYEIEVKADGYAKLIRQLESDAAGLKTEIQRMTDRKKTLENNIKRLKDNLQKAMEITGKEKFKTDLFSFGIQNNPPSFRMDAKSVYDVPDDFLIYKEPEIDTVKAKKFLKENKAEWGHLEQGRSLRIR